MMSTPDRTRVIRAVARPARLFAAGFLVAEEIAAALTQRPFSYFMPDHMLNSALGTSAADEGTGATVSAVTHSLLRLHHLTLSQCARGDDVTASTVEALEP
jgi:hypothetical protein